MTSLNPQFIESAGSVSLYSTESKADLVYVGFAERSRMQRRVCVARKKLKSGSIETQRQ